MVESYFKDRLSGYLDKSLPPEEMAVMDEYVKKSEEARRILAEFRKLDEFVREHSDLGGEDYWERQAQKVEQAIGLEASPKATDIRPRRSRNRFWRGIAVAASVGFLAFIGLHQSDIFDYQERVRPIPAPSVMDQEKAETAAEAGRDKAAPEEAAIDTTVAEKLEAVDANLTKSRIGIPAPMPDQKEEEKDLRGVAAAKDEGKTVDVELPEAPAVTVDAEKEAVPAPAMKPEEIEPQIKRQPVVATDADEMIVISDSAIAESAVTAELEEGVGVGAVEELHQEAVMEEDLVIDIPEHDYWPSDIPNAHRLLELPEAERDSVLHAQQEARARLSFLLTRGDDDGEGHAAYFAAPTTPQEQRGEEGVCRYGRRGAGFIDCR